MTAGVAVSRLRVTTGSTSLPTSTWPPRAMMSPLVASVGTVLSWYCKAASRYWLECSTWSDQRRTTIAEKATSTARPMTVSRRP
jgi:hypothetical protein